MSENEPLNREQRRHPEQMEDDAKGVEEYDRAQSSQDDILKQGNQDVHSVRAKNSGHGKKTADKWNQ